MIAGMLLVIAAPLLLIASTTIWVLSRRAPFVAHRRIGHRGRPIWVIKLRTMWGSQQIPVRRWQLIERLTENVGSKAILQFPNKTCKLPSDSRVTSRLARICRKYSIDELPQLWQVVTGDLALIGPRPLTAEEIETYYGETATQLLSAKPGLSGLWQVKGRSRLTYRQRCRLDLFMIRKWSFGLYARILMATIPSVLTGRNAW
jgi:exopolysaccharide production protein ExoY